MEQNSKVKRLQSLDGIRGIAILLVFLNHVDATFLGQLFPPALMPLNKMIFTSGVTGVSLLFILSGFLMTYIYPHPKSYVQFLQKRYTRIFPLFITMASVMIFYHVLPGMVWYEKFGLLVGFALISHTIWIYGIKKVQSEKFSRSIFLSFVAIQIFAALLYVFWIMRNAPIVFNQQIPELLRNSIIWLINATVTLPFGTIIPQLDGVYWSLTSEILFYIVYPILCVPLIGFMMRKGRWYKVLVFAILIPFFAGVHILSQRFYGFGILQLQLFYYFIAGITLAYLYRNHVQLFDKTANLLPKQFQILLIVLFFAAILSKTLLFNPLNKAMDVWIHILWAIPLGIIVFLALSHRTLLERFLASKPLVFLGTISFSIYLSHVPIGLILKDIYHPTNWATNIVFILLHLLITVLLSSLLYYLLERPYFMRRENIAQKGNMAVIQPPLRVKQSLWLLGGIVIGLLLLIFNAYQSQFNIFSKAYPIKNPLMIDPQNIASNTTISLREHPKILLQFTSPENNLQILTINLSEKIDPKIADKTQIFTFKIKEAGAKDWYAQNAYNLASPISSENHPLGFPPIHEAKGKTFIVELGLTHPSSGKYLVIDASNSFFKDVIQVDKKSLLTNPSETLSFARNKIETVVANKEAQQVIQLLTPFFVFVIFELLLYKQNKKAASDTV